MNETFTVDSMIKEIKKNLDKYETMLKTYESYQSQKSYTEIITLQKAIAKNIGMVQPIATKEEHKYMLNSYKEVHTELNKRLNQTQMKIKQTADKDRLNKLFNDQKGEIRNTGNINTLSEENQLLKGMIQMSNEINNNTIIGNNELADQENSLKRSNEQNIKILKKIPIIESILGKIKFHYVKEKIILGMVIGFIAVLGIYLTFYR